MNALDVLKAARVRITEPEHWTQGAFARDAGGAEVLLANDVNATCWCAAGAVSVSAGLFGRVLYESAIKELRRTITGSGFAIGDYNDEHTHAEVLAVFDKAINRLEHAGQHIGKLEKS